MLKKKIKDLTLEEVKAICLKARTKANGKVRNKCVEDCPLNTRSPLPFDFSLRACDIIAILNKNIEVDEKVLKTIQETIEILKEKFGESDE